MQEQQLIRMSQIGSNVLTDDNRLLHKKLVSTSSFQSK